MSAPMFNQVKTNGICKTGSVLKGLKHLPKQSHTWDIVFLMENHLSLFYNAMRNLTYDQTTYHPDQQIMHYPDFYTTTFKQMFSFKIDLKIS
jgi:hypothetical protein